MPLNLVRSEYPRQVPYFYSPQAATNSSIWCQAFDRYTATLGLPTELAVPDDGDDGEIPFPSLADKICFGLRGRSFLPQ